MGQLTDNGCARKSLRRCRRDRSRTLAESAVAKANHQHLDGRFRESYRREIGGRLSPTQRIAAEWRVLAVTPPRDALPARPPVPPPPPSNSPCADGPAL